VGFPMYSHCVLRSVLCFFSHIQYYLSKTYIKKKVFSVEFIALIYVVSHV
jgi:hypothetical protein